MGELYGMDLKGRPLAYIPFCDNNKDMDGYWFLFATSGTVSWVHKDGFSHSRFWFWCRIGLGAGCRMQDHDELLQVMSCLVGSLTGRIGCRYQVMVMLQ
ncbi:hypothetical protein KIW84_066340 [Lathyrus oleraceus]|uniref:Glucosyltransferase 24 catalytic domain-containing protein n=1 Tax=Pisum sativum TaxID=3888 RepID=A0A9D4WHH2_PEA|nr:hypothetical protein KIW84_066340 [Pisum sativum]